MRAVSAVECRPGSTPVTIAASDRSRGRGRPRGSRAASAETHRGGKHQGGLRATSRWRHRGRARGRGGNAESPAYTDIAGGHMPNFKALPSRLICVIELQEFSSIASSNSNHRPCCLR